MSWVENVNFGLKGRCSGFSIGPTLQTPRPWLNESRPWLQLHSIRMKNVHRLFAFGLNPHILLTVPLSYAQSSPDSKKYNPNKPLERPKVSCGQGGNRSRLAKGQELSGQKYHDLVLWAPGSEPHRDSTRLHFLPSLLQSWVYDTSFCALRLLWTLVLIALTRF